MTLSKVNRQRMLAYGLLLPAFIVCAVFIVYPLGMTVVNSFKPGAGMNLSKNAKIEFNATAYGKILKDMETWKVLGKTFVYLFGSLIPSYLLGLGTALMLNKKFAGRRTFRLLTILPWAIPGVVASIMFMWMFDSTYGVINHLLMKIGLIDAYKPWFVDRQLVMFSVILPTIWKGYPFFTITLLAALQAIPIELYEAADVDGCRGWSKFIHITWPEISEASVLALILNGLWSFRVFDIIYPITKGGPGTASTTIAIKIYNEAFQYFDINKASVLGVVSVVVCGIICIIFYPYMNQEGK